MRDRLHKVEGTYSRMPAEVQQELVLMCLSEGLPFVKEFTTCARRRMPLKINLNKCKKGITESIGKAGTCLAHQ